MRKSEMRELTFNEIEYVSGGGDWNSWQTAGATIFGLSLYSPFTAAFGMPIGAAVFGLGSWNWGARW
jgi:hypothetical protein